ncbi:MAG TPA: ribonuclease III, partial [Casimicrobiaceae bacterium]|nr:ribonuclease III [Casimicrobiaceae bacterium]
MAHHPDRSTEPAPIAIDHAFSDPSLLRQALTHRSFGVPHNERLEFVGDAVLNCVVALTLYERFPALPEGDLSRARAHLVNRDTLSEVARRLGLGAAIRLGEGELRSGGARRPSILADAMEAVFGAVFVDGGYDAARRVIDGVYAALLSEADPTTLGKDAKTRLQEWLQAKRLPVPEYAIVG